MTIQKNNEDIPNEDISSGNGIDLEGNLFQTLGQNDYDEDEDDDNLIEPERSLDDYVEEEQEEEEEEEEIKDSLFKVDPNEEEEEDEENLNEKDLELFNKKLGTDFKSVEELKKGFSKQEEDSETKKEEVEYKILTNKISLFDKYIGMDNENLVRNQLLSQAAQEKKDTTDPDVLEDIEEKIQGLNDLNQLDSMADTLRSNLLNQKDKTAAAVKQIDDKRIASENEIARKNTNDLQNALADIFTQKEFLGITVTKEDIHDVYQDIKSNKFFDSVNNNQEMIAKFAMFLKYEKQISELGKRPTHSDKTKDAFSLLSGNDGKQRRSITQANGSASSGNAKDNLNAFLK